MNVSSEGPCRTRIISERPQKKKKVRPHCADVALTDKGEKPVSRYAVATRAIASNTRVTTITITRRDMYGWIFVTHTRARCGEMRGRRRRGQNARRLLHEPPVSVRASRLSAGRARAMELCRSSSGCGGDVPVILLMTFCLSVIVRGSAVGILSTVSGAYVLYRARYDGDSKSFRPDKENHMFFPARFQVFSGFRTRGMPLVRPPPAICDYRSRTISVVIYDCLCFRCISIYISYDNFHRRYRSNTYYGTELWALADLPYFAT